MKKLKLIIIFGIFIGNIYSWSSESPMNYKTNFNNFSDSIINNYIVAPSFSAKIRYTKNIIYCSTFEIAWNSIRDNIIKEPILLNTSIDWVNYLNQQPENKSISCKYYSSFSGFAKDGVYKKFQKDLLKRFKYDYKSTYSALMNDICSFSYMRKEVEFISELNEDFGGEQLIFNNEYSVDFFGLMHGWANPDYKKSLMIHDYVNSDDFIFQIGTKNGEDEIFFAKIKPEETLIESYNSVMTRVKKNKIELLGEEEQIRIPYISFKIKNNFTEVENAKILNKDFQKYSIGSTIQMIDFDLNERGICLESSSEVYILEELSFYETKKLIFDKPFLIIMKEKNVDLPYFLMWVGNTEFMKRK